MGFGLLFIGYFAVFLMSWHSLSSLVQLIGYGVIVMALGRLRQYHRSFGLALCGALAALLVTCGLAFVDVTEYLYNNLILADRIVSLPLQTGLEYVEQGVSFAFHVLLLWAIRAIARETEVPKLATNAIRNFVFICMYEAIALLRLLPVEGIRACAAELTLISMILYLTWIILNLILFGSCYAKICDEGDVDMTQKPSRFAFVNRFREEMNRREQKAIEEDRAYRREKRQRKKRRK